MNILITGGGCEEPIDDVRSVCNFSTGKTSSLIADCLVKAGHNVICLSGYRAIKSKNCIVHMFRTFEDLKLKLEQTLSQNEFDAVIHAAAVSDYSPDFVTIDGKNYPAGSINKIPSGKTFSVTMKQNPKLIESVKRLSKKNCILIGFKLTDRFSDGEKFDAVRKVFYGKNQEINADSPDFVVLNDKSEITESVHPCTVFDRTLSKVFECSSVCSLSYGLLKLIEKRTEV